MATRAEEYIKRYETEWNKLATFRSLWQATADLTFPRENNITTIYAQGTEKITHADDTAITDSKIMADGLLSALIPAGEYFFQLNVDKDNIGGQSEEYTDYLARATDKLHRELFSSNFLMQMGETMRAIIVFGTGDIFSEWSSSTRGLNFKDYDISLYVILENDEEMVDTIMLKFPFTARQAVKKWRNKAGKSVLEAYESETKRNDIFQFLHIVRPREERNPRLIDNLNAAFESVFVGIKDKNLIDEGGFPEFPYHTPRWMKTTGEIMGRGQGTEHLKQIRVVNQQMVDFNEMSNKFPNPARDVLSSVEGDYAVYPGARNEVSELPASAVIEGMQGAFPITKEVLEMQREVIHTAFYKDVFMPLVDLKGDRRTTLEVRERLIEGLKRVGQPVSRLQTELLEPLIRRCFNLLIRNGVIPEPPLGLETYEIEYLGLMANALSSGQASAFQKAIVIAKEMEDTFPGTKDNLNIDEGFRNLCRRLGVRSEDINTPEQREEIRRQRIEQAEQQKALEAAQVASQAYGQTMGAPEEGSPAGALMGTTG